VQERQMNRVPKQVLVIRNIGSLKRSTEFLVLLASAGRIEDVIVHFCLLIEVGLGLRLQTEAVDRLSLEKSLF
jgi:hypothetical protein